MRLITTILLAASLLLGQQAFAASPLASDFHLPTQQGGAVTLQQFKGKVVYLDFWATWCGPCRKSFPWMNEMHTKYKDQGLQIIAVSLDSKMKMVEKFLKKYPAAFSIALDSEGHVADQYKVAVMPTSYLIDRNGHIIDRHQGFRSKDADKLESQIRAALAK